MRDENICIFFSNEVQFPFEDKTDPVKMLLIKFNRCEKIIFPGPRKKSERKKSYWRKVLNVVNNRSQSGPDSQPQASGHRLYSSGQNGQVKFSQFRIGLKLEVYHFFRILYVRTFFVVPCFSPRVFKMKEKSDFQLSGTILALKHF